MTKMHKQVHFPYFAIHIVSVCREEQIPILISLILIAESRAVEQREPSDIHET